MSTESDHEDAVAADGASGTDGGDGSGPDFAPSESAAFERLLDFLKETRAFDFTGYKRPSLTRRIQHRMRDVGIDSVDEYLDLLQLQPEEFTALFNTILINVTGFFRDQEAWDHLRDALIPELLDQSQTAPVRVWSAGCSAGQEAYSIAMLLHDAMGDTFRDRVKIYATDIDEEALDHARQAVYSEREMRGVPDPFRERYFEQNGARWQLVPDLRRSVIFGRNDVTQDAPISRIDILLCRNTLMYLNAETQSRVVSRLGFALRPQGVLLLGKAEMLLNHTATFDPIDLKRRFFRKTRSTLPEAPFTVPGRLYENDGLSLQESRLRQQLVMTSPVAQVVVGSDRRVIVVNHRAAAMLGLSQLDAGRPLSELDLSYAVPELGPELMAAMQRGESSTLREVQWRRAKSEPTYLDISLVPLVDPAGKAIGMSITLTDVTRFRDLQLEVEATNRQLETAYEELQSTNEELETTNEELQSTVEELETTNEELQSTNEELETMNEELQSANDELQITNEQLRDRTLAVSELNSFTQSIFNSMDAAVLVVDRELVVQVWSRQAEDMWGLRESETVGQPLDSLDSGLPVEALNPSLKVIVSGQVGGVNGQHLQAINRRGRTIDLRVTVTAMTDGPGQTIGALILCEEWTVDDVRQTGHLGPLEEESDEAGSPPA